MVCKLIQAELIAYELATIDDAGRDQVEAHLVGCRECLQTYLRLKRHLSQSAGSGERPSDAVRRRIRAEVEASFRPSLIHRIRRWMTRPIPLYQGFATAAFAAAVVVIAPAVVRHHAASTPPDHAETVDTSRSRADNLTIY